MRAVALHAFGGPEILAVHELPLPALGHRDVLIRVAYAGVNPADWKECEGALATADGSSAIVPSRRYQFPVVPGLDASGVIAATGPEVNGYAVGDRVVTVSDGPAKWGTYAEYVAVRSDHIAPMPAVLDFAGAAAYPVAGMTGWQALFDADKGRLADGDSVLIHGAAGGVGSYAVQCARARGVRVAATCRTSNVDYVCSLGAECVIDYMTQDIVAELRAWAPGGVDAIVDAVSMGTLRDPFSLLKPGGRWVSIATMTGDGDIEADQRAAAACGFEKIFAVVGSRRCRQQLDEIGALIATGAVGTPPLTLFDLDEAGAAHRLMKTGHVRGKIVLRVADLR